MGIFRRASACALAAVSCRRRAASVAAAGAIAALVSAGAASATCLSTSCEGPVSPAGPMIFTSITSPTQGSTVKGTVAITAEVDGDVAPPVRVEFYFDSILIGSDDTYPYSVQWNTLDPAQPAYDGTHALTVRAWDSRTNNRSGMTKVTVANTAGSAYQATFSSTTVPQTVLYDPSAGTQQGSSVDLTVTNRSATAG
jgi:hypothetical protein